MSPECGVVLYVIAKHRHDQKVPWLGRGPRPEHGLTKRQIGAEIVRYLGEKRAYSRDVINQACVFLLKHGYCQLKGGKASKKYVILESSKTPPLALHTTDLTIISTVAALVDELDRCSLEDAHRACYHEVGEVAKILTWGDTQDAILRLSGSASAPGYFIVREEGVLELNRVLLEEEEPYLQCIARWKFSSPRRGTALSWSSASTPTGQETASAYPSTSDLPERTARPAATKTTKHRTAQS
jgi:hypothetical protein